MINILPTNILTTQEHKNPWVQCPWSILWPSGRVKTIVKLYIKSYAYGFNMQLMQQTLIGIPTPNCMRTQIERMYCKIIIRSFKFHFFIDRKKTIERGTLFACWLQRLRAHRYPKYRCQNIGTSTMDLCQQIVRDCSWYHLLKIKCDKLALPAYSSSHMIYMC